MTDRVAAALAAGAVAKAMEASEREDAAPKGKRRLTRRPEAFLAGFSQRCWAVPDFFDAYHARAALLGYEALGEAQVERARQAAIYATGRR